MEPYTSTALVRKRTDTELMPPPPPPKRIKRPRKVLDEETYTDSISHIIARDFYPGLLETETQSEYLDALDSKDEGWINSAGRRLAQVMTPGRQRGRKGTSIHGAKMETPIKVESPATTYGMDSPGSARSGVSSATQMPAQTVDTSLSLGAFQAKYTSEDNESFYKLLDKQNEKRAEKYAWLWTGNKLPSKQMLKQREVKERLLEERKSSRDDGATGKMLALQDSDQRPARPDAWKSKPNNEFMFAPEGVEDAVETRAQRAEASSRAAPKQVVYSNTRMAPLVSVENPAAPTSPTLSAIQDAIAGRPRPTDSEPGYTGGETPRVNGYAFVEEDEPEPEFEPLPAPKIILGKGDATPNPFKIKEQSWREDLHHRMVEKTAANKRTSSYLGLTGKVDKTPVPRFPSSPMVGQSPRAGSGGLTPAAQRLWSKVGKTPSRSGFGDQTPAAPKSKLSTVKARWTPKR